LGRRLSGMQASPATVATPNGTTTRSDLIEFYYPLGAKVSDEDLAAVPPRRHAWHGKWNYTVLPPAR
jgi:hypothetical protein